MDCGHAGSLRHLAFGPEEKLAKCITGGLGAEKGEPCRTQVGAAFSTGCVPAGALGVLSWEHLTWESK